MDKKRLRKLAGLKEADRFQSLDPAAVSLLKQLAKIAREQANKQMKNAIGMRKAWLDNEAKYHIYDQMAITLGDLAGHAGEDEVIGYFQNNFDVDAGNNQEVSDLAKINSLVLLRDLLKDTQETLHDTINDVGLDSVLDIEVDFVKAVMKAKL